jgi:hypothetical protein
MQKVHDWSFFICPGQASAIKVLRMEIRIFRHLPFQENKVAQRQKNCKRETQKSLLEIALLFFIFSIINAAKMFIETPGKRRKK